MRKKRRIQFLLLIFTAVIFIVNIVLGFKEQKVKASYSNVGEKVIYLTFDDGPSSVVTNDILNILKQNGVKATFFVIGNKIKGREEILKRIYDEGHGVGLHTFSHEYKKIYENEDAFIREMIETSEEVKRVIGYKTNIVRFPYGSNSHLNDKLLKKLHDNNFKVYDWNASISDGVKPHSSPEEFTQEAIATSNGIPYVVFLMHCNNINTNTCKALPKIIQYYKKEGYKFKVITNSTPEFYWHNFN